MQMEGMDLDSCDIVSVDKHLCQVFWDPASKINNLDADLTTSKETGLFLVSAPIFPKYSSLQ